MPTYIPFLTSRNSETDITPEMELASAFLYFEFNKPESIMNIFSKQPKDVILWAARGFYPLKAKLFSREDKTYCIYDAVGILGNAEINCRLDCQPAIDFKSLSSISMKSRIDELKKLLGNIKPKGKEYIETSHLIYGYKNLGDILKGKDTDKLSYLTEKMKALDEGYNNTSSLIGEAIFRIQRSIEQEIQLVKELCVMDEQNFKDSINCRENLNEEYKDKIHQTEVEISGKITKLIMERQDSLKDVEKIYSDRKTNITQDYISNKNKYDISKVSGNEIEMEIYLKAMEDAEIRLKQLNKEEAEEAKKVERQYENLLDTEEKRLELISSDRDSKVKESEDLYNTLHSTLDELKKAVYDDIQLRKNQVEEIKGWFARFGSYPDYEELDIFIPFYAAQYKGNNKCRIFFPHILEGKKQFLSMLSGITGRVSLPFREREDFFGEFFDNLEEYICGENKDASGIFSKSNLLSMDNTFGMVEKGMKELMNLGYISDRNYEKILNIIRSSFTES